VTDTKQGGWRALRDTNCDVAFANNSLHTSNAYTTRFTGNIMDWHVGVGFRLEVTEYFTRQVSGLPVQLTPALLCFNTPIVYLMVNTNNSLHIKTKITQYTRSAIFTCNNITTRASVQRVTEANWLTKARDSRCAEASKIQPPSFVSRILGTAA
jgi:hypothetical protein